MPRDSDRQREHQVRQLQLEIADEQETRKLKARRVAILKEQARALARQDEVTRRQDRR